MTEYYLWLLQFMGAANPRSLQLIRHYGSVCAVYEAFKHENGGVRFLKENEAAALKTASLEKSCSILDMAQKSGYRVITLDDAEYPLPLKNIYNPPPVLFAAGLLPESDTCLTVIGTREACDYSFKVTGKLCGRLAKEGVTIVSGMAIGIDKAAHTAAVEAKGRTVGVLACGFGVDYPKFSTPFRQEMINAGGAVISELLPGQRGERGYFNQRNRIMSGLSRGVLIIEAGERSGCHITARHAVNQNRDIFCIPPADIYNPRFKGVIGYIRDGAIPVFDHSDILNEYLIKPTAFEVKSGADDTVPETFEDAERTAPVTAKPFEVIPQKPPAADLSALTPDGLKIAALLSGGTKTLDFIAENTELSADELSDLLLELELDGVIESAAGAGYKLCGM